MLLWFLGTSFLSVWFVFRDDQFDYRVLALGAVVPDIIDLCTGGTWAMHSVLAPISALIVVMAVARRGSVRRRRWLALPIGMFLHLVFDGAFNNTKNFWWPLAGFSFEGKDVPSLDRMGLNIILEIAGAAMLLWVWKTNNLSSPSARERFLRTGRLVGAVNGEVGKC
ncbi:unannotated protein [freshwater metagenome]|uniref:Unannotated protein n=1 Tax=freshwater metagenome TaxID=449393 RepID=A0A6J6GZJ1_9ZZZZ|nr:hypothetical protein [Actinomycetota bacterium]